MSDVVLQLEGVITRKKTDSLMLGVEVALMEGHRVQLIFDRVTGITTYACRKIIKLALRYSKEGWDAIEFIDMSPGVQGALSYYFKEAKGERNG